MPRTNTIRVRADWMQMLEAAVDDEPDDRRWAKELVETAKPIFPNADSVGMMVVPSDESLVPESFVVEAGTNDADHMRDAMGNAPPAVFRAMMHPPVPVTTHREIFRSIVDEDVRAYLAGAPMPVNNYSDALGVVAHPVPGMILVLWSTHDREIALTRHERELLTRLASHIEAGYRARKVRGAVKAVLGGDGRLLSREDDAPAAATLEARGQRLSQARSRPTRATADATALWPALIDGRFSLVPRGTSARRRYDVIENAPTTTRVRALTTSERAVLDACAQGLSNKAIAYSLGLSPSVVSTRLATCTAKLGLSSRLELLRVASMLAGTPGRNFSDAELSKSERDVLALLERGLSNHQIASLRSRSTRTIANQVASLLRKTETTSRRELIARAAAGPRP